MDGHLFVTSIDGVNGQIHKLQQVDNSNIYEATNIWELPGSISSGIGVEWADDCSQKYLVASWIEAIGGDSIL
jgi:hypothetical protein